MEARWRSSISLRSALLLHRAPGRILSERLLERVDSEAALQSPGAVGLRAELATPSLNAPVTFSIDSFAVTSPKSRSSRAGVHGTGDQRRQPVPPSSPVRRPVTVDRCQNRRRPGRSPPIRSSSTASARGDASSRSS